MAKHRHLLILCLVGILTPTRSLLGQSTSAAITGQITDPLKAVIVQAKVTAIDNNTNVRYEGTTNQTGSYLIPSVPPGDYRIEVEKTGFKTIVKPDVILHVQDTIELNFEMALGSASETVTVEGGAPLINTENAAVSTVIDRNFAESLPLNGRSFNTLLQLTPGVVIAPSNSLSPGQFSVAGQRTDANNFLVDGVSANFGVSPTASVSGGAGQAQAFSALGGTSSLVSVDALQEFRIETSSFAPEFGKTPGGQVILTTRSGTNDFHGGLFEYFRNDVMDANNWFINAAGKPRAAERHNDFGGFLGGPVVKNRTFFFVSYEGARLRQPQGIASRVPSLAARSSAPTGVAPFMNAFPLPNGPVLPGGTIARFTGSFSNPAALDAGSIRIDHTFNERFAIFGRYNNAPSQTITRGSDLSQLNTTSINTQTLTVGSTMQFSARTSNSLRGNYSTQNSGLILTSDSLGGAVPLDPSLLLGSLPVSKSEGAFLLIGTGLYALGPSARNKTSQFNVVDNFGLTLGVHQLKFGGDYRAVYLDNNAFEHQLFYSATIPGLSSTGRANVLARTTAATQLLYPSLSLYAQDTWKIRSRLSLTYGLRWELNPAPRARGGSVLGSWTKVNDPATTALAPPGTAVWNTTYANFAPRIGIAYSLTQKGDFVLRAGFGLFYDLGVGESARLGDDFPNFGSKSFPRVAVPIADATPFLPVLSPQPPYTGIIFAFSPNLKLPRSSQWNLALEKSFGNKQVISATYVGQTGRDLLRQAASNPSNVNSNFAPGSVFNLTESSATSNYHALQVQYRRPLANRLQMLANYTWSHSIDNVSNDTVQVISGTVFSNQNDRGSSDFDVRQSFSAALTYAPPALARSGVLRILTRDWSVDSIVVARSGFPFNAVVGGVPSPVQGTLIRADRVPGQPAWVNSPSAPGGKMLNSAMDPITGAFTGAFAVPPQDPVTGAFLRQGNEARNDIPGFGFTQVDLSIGRKFPITEKFKLQFRADAFNVLNHPNFANPDGVFDLGDIQSTIMLNQELGGLNPLFQQGGPRSLQLSLKLVF